MKQIDYDKSGVITAQKLAIYALELKKLMRNEDLLEDDENEQAEIKELAEKYQNFIDEVDTKKAGFIKSEDILALIKKLK